MSDYLLKDVAITKAEEDRLGYTLFADRIVRTVNTFTDFESFYFAICGSWGIGKTSILNLVRNQIKKEDKFIIIDYNPWNIIDKEKQIEDFFYLLKTKINDDSKDIRLKKQINKYAKSLINSVEPRTLLGRFVKNILNTNENQQKYSISYQKELLHNYLKNNYYGKPVLVIIDDLDRLTNSETCLILKLIRELAGLPNIYYLVAFDKEQIVHAINTKFKFSSGEKYLRKFFQLQWNVPVPTKDIIRNFMLDKLKQRKDIKEKLEKNDIYYEKMFDNCLYKYVKNYRDVIIVYNSFYQRYENQQYLNIVDLLALTIYELFYSKLYDFIRLHQSDLLTEKGLSDSEKQTYLQLKNESEEKFGQKVFNSRIADFFDDSEIEDVKKILFFLFPNFAKLCFSIPGFIEDEPTANYKISSPIWFNSYFSQTDSKYTGIILIKSLVQNGTLEEILKFFKDKYADPELIDKLFTQFSQEIIEIEDSSRLLILLESLFLVGQNVIGSVMTKEGIFTKNVRRDVYEIILQILRKDSMIKIRGGIYNILKNKEFIINSYKFSTYFLNLMETEGKHNILFDERDKFQELKKEMIHVLSEKITSIEIFNNELENVVFSFFEKNYDLDTQHAYMDQLKNIDNIISLIITENYTISLSGANELNEAMQRKFPKISLLHDIEKKVQNYVNDGNYLSLDKYSISVLAEICKCFSLEKEVTSENKEKWDKLYQYINIDSFFYY